LFPAAVTKNNALVLTESCRNRKTHLGLHPSVPSLSRGSVDFLIASRPIVDGPAKLIGIRSENWTRSLREAKRMLLYGLYWRDGGLRQARTIER